MEEVTKCEVCGNTGLRSVLNLGLHPLCDDLVPFGSDRVCKESPIEILFCATCNTAHQLFQVGEVINIKKQMNSSMIRDAA